MLPSSAIERLNGLDVKRVVVAFSGGLDSTVLLHLVKGAGLTAPVHALHVNHGLNAEADHWQAHCERTCSALEVDFTAVKVSVNTQGSLEENARQARFAAFEKFLAPGDLLLLAHHLDDQIETLFFYLLRGNTLTGIRGMPAERPLGPGVLFRPLLDMPRSTLVRYAKQEALDWVEDASNTDLGLDRNYLRHQVIPRIRARWPDLDQTLSGALDRSEETLQLIDWLGEGDLAASLAADGGLPLEALGALPAARARNLLRYWIGQTAMVWPPAAVLAEAVDTLATADEDATPLVAWQALALRRFRDRIYLVRDLAGHDNTRSFTFTGEALDVAGGTLSAEFVKGRGIAFDGAGELIVAFRRGGERIKLGRSRTLKNLFRELGVPPWLRDRLPLVYKDGELVAIAGLPAWKVPPVTARGWAVGEDETGLIFHFYIADRAKSD